MRPFRLNLIGNEIEEIVTRNFDAAILGATKNKRKQAGGDGQDMMIEGASLEELSKLAESHFNNAFREEHFMGGSEHTPAEFFKIFRDFWTSYHMNISLLDLGALVI